MIACKRPLSGIRVLDFGQFLAGPLVGMMLADMGAEGMGLKGALHTALGMSMVSMISMEAAMNATDWFLTGGAVLTWWVIPIMLAAGFITPWPYNYWRLKKWKKSCH